MGQAPGEGDRPRCAEGSGRMLGQGLGAETSEEAAQGSWGEK